MRTKVRKFLCLLLTVALCAGMFTVPSMAVNEDMGHVVISQLYGGGGNSGAPYKNDFIELYNPTDSDVSLNGWSVQYSSAAGAFNTNKTALSSDATIKAHGYYLIQEAGGSNGVALPTADCTGTINMSSTAGKVALVSNTDTITDSDTSTANVIDDTDIIDFVGFGGASAYEISAAPAVGNTVSIIRTAYNNNNSMDFEAIAPNPRNSSYTESAETKCAVPVASSAAGTVFSGTQVTFSCTTSGAGIQYNTTAADATDWVTGSIVTVSSNTTYYVRAVKDGLTTSDLATFAYMVADAETFAGTIADAKAAAVNTAGIMAKGIVTYINGKNVYIQDSTGAICLFLNANNVNLRVGDQVAAIGKRDNYSNLIELTGINEADIKVLSHDNSTPDRGTASVAELVSQPIGRTAGFEHMCEIVKVSGAELSSTSKLSQGGSDITIYPAVKLTDFSGVSVGDLVDATLRVYDYNGTLEVEIISMIKSDSAPSGTMTVIASPASGSVVSGTMLTLSCSGTTTAAIFYTTNGEDPTTGSAIYVSPVMISGNAGETVTVKAIAVKNDVESSGIATFTYMIKDPDASNNIKQVLALSSGTKDVVVTGQIAYFATSYSNPVIQEVIDGKTYSLYIFGSVPDGTHVGDIIKCTGTYSLYYGLPELSGLTTSEKIGTDTPITAETVTIANLKANGTNMLGRFIKIKDVTLGTYNSSGSTHVTDATGTIDIYQATAYPTGVEAGDVVDLYAMVSIHNTTVQLNIGTASANGFNVYDVTNDTKAPVITLPDSFLQARTGQDYTISVNASDNKGIQAVTITYTIGAAVKTSQAMIKNAGSDKYEYTIPGTEIMGTASDIKFTVAATDVTNLSASSNETIIAINNKPQIIAVTPARNSATGDNKAPEISVTLDNAGAAPSVIMTLKKGDTSLISNQAMNLKSGENDVYAYNMFTLADGKYTVSVTVTRSDSQSTTENWSFSVGTARYTSYFGQLHAHTAQYSDGSGTLQDGLNYFLNIPKSDNVDFVSFTDHSNYFDSTSASNPAEALNDKSKMTAASRALWDKYVSDMTAFNSEHAGSRVAMPGFEMTWSGGPGHINTFNSDGLVSRNNTNLNNKTNDAGMKLYYDTLIQNTDPLANLSQFNHPGTTFGTFSDFAYWCPAYDNKMVAVEVGNGEGAIDSGGYFPSYAEYTKALDKGWHVAPTNNQDNHKGHWGNSNTARTVIITDDFSTVGLQQGMKDMSVYSTEDKNLNLSYTVNDQMMGSIISEVPASPLKFSVDFDDPDTGDVISKVEIVTNSGRVACSRTFTANSANWEFELPAAKGYYYVRVTEADKNIAVTAPVWIGQAPLMGINSVECSTKLPVTEEELTLTATLFNNEDSAATVKSITYSQGNNVLKTQTPNTQIASMGTMIDTFAYTPAAAGSTTVTVTAVFSLNGEDSEFTKSVNLNIRDSQKLVYAGIDASHHNEYVDGNYKDSMGNFADMATNSDVRVVELKTGEALIAATQNPKYKMLVLTPPTRRNGDKFLIGYKSYSDEEITAIKKFAEAGGTVIVTGWGDYYEGYTKYSDDTAYTLPVEQHMAAQQNKLLAALGASLRVSDDEIKDDTHNGGQAQRLYLTNYNMTNSFLYGVKQAEQVYSNYGGSTVYAVHENGQPVQTLTDAVSPMVYAFDTSYSSDDDHDGCAGVTIPKYDGKYLVAATETVHHSNNKNSTVIVAGSAFMSNFEIQATLDSYSTPAYSNYTILQNVVRSINPVTITDIAEVQKAAEGNSFTIRGTVTSNASGYDKNTAFFDCIYVQDNTAGINAFPVSGDIKAGQTVEITGVTSSYNGERQIAVNKITVIDENVQNLPEAISETTAQAADGGNLGSLVTVTGTVISMTSPNNVVESIYIKDSSGVKCRVFVDGYITNTKTIANLNTGATLTATGLSSADTEGFRIRIRDRSDIVCTITDTEKVAADKDILTWDTIKGTNILQDSVTSNLNLAVAGELYVSTVTWKSSNPKVITDSGIVSRPPYSGEDANVTVTATVYRNGVSAAKDFSIKVLKLAQSAHTVTFKDWDGTVLKTQAVDDGGEATAPNDPVRTDYTFTGWDVRFNNVTGDLTVTAQYIKKSTGGSSSGGRASNATGSGAVQKYQAVVSGENKAATKVQINIDADKSNAIIELGSVQGTIDADKGLDSIIMPNIPDVSKYTIGIPVHYLSEADEKSTLTISSENGNIIIPKNMLTGTTGEEGQKAHITIGQGDKSALTEGEKAVIGDRPLIQLTMAIDGKQTEWSNAKAPVTLSIPYTPTPAERANAESIIVWYIDGSGNAICIPNGHYDSATGTVTFVTTHFSCYAVGYNKESFADVASDTWYSKAVSFIAARSITMGTGNGNYSPKEKLTRAEFLVLLMRAYGIAPDANPSDNFDDAGSTYYTGYLAKAKESGISGGVSDNRFEPGREITRQEMCTFLYNALKEMSELPQNNSGKQLSAFSDMEQVASWAKDAMTLLAETGVISGNDGTLNPAGIATRAEMAQVLYNLMSDRKQ